MNSHSRGLLSALRTLDKVKLGAEVGVWRGSNAQAMLQSFPNLFLYLVDTYRDEGQPKALSSKMTAAQARTEAQEAVAPYAGRVQWFITTSVETARMVEDETFDYVFIDADHAYESVKEDIEAWHPKVRPGGIVAGHDYSVHHKGVIRAVKERFREDFQVARGKVWWTKKKEGRTSSASLL